MLMQKITLCHACHERQAANRNKDKTKMKISIDNQTLTRASEIAATIAEKNASDVRSLGRFIADKNKLSISTTNLLSSVEITVACEVRNPGSICLPIHLLTAIAKKMPGSRIYIEQEGFRVMMASSDTSQYELPALAPEIFPEIEPTNDFCNPVSTEEFKRAMAAVAHCLSRNSDRTWLNGIRIELDDEGITFSTTDGHRLARYYVKISNPNLYWPLPGATIDMPPLYAALHCADGTIRAASDDARIWIDTGDTRWAIILRENAWPDFNSILRTPATTLCQIDGAHLLSALQRLILMVDKDNRAVRIQHLPESLILHAANGTGQGEERVPCSLTNEKTWACDIKYLLDAIQACPSQNIALDVVDSKNPIIISSPDVPQWISAIMPQRMD